MLAQRMVAAERFELPGDLRVTACCELALEPLLETGQS